MARHMARASVVCGTLTLAAIGFDRATSIDIFSAVWPWRCLAALFCLGVAIFGFRSRNAVLTGYAYGGASVSIMSVVEFAGIAAPPATQENYMLAAITLFSVCLAAVPIPLRAGLVTCLVGAVLHPTLPLLFGGDPGHFISDTIIGSAASLTVFLIVRKNDVDRRRRFLESLRYEQAATELNQMNQELLRLSNTDALTELPNRRFFESEAARLRADGERQSMGAIVIDVDHFKKYNDKAGHIAGDVCLRMIAQALAQEARKQGVSIARYGGEEFAAMVASRDREELERVCEGLRTAVSSIDLPHPGLPGRNVSISIGAAWRDHFDGDAQALMKEADRALYEAKAAGRDCIAWSDAIVDIGSPGICSRTPRAHDGNDIAAIETVLIAQFVAAKTTMQPRG